MSWTPLLNNEPFAVTTDDLPTLIHGEEHSGASLFTMTLLSQLYRQGHPLIFLTGKAEAKEEFIAQTNCGDELTEIDASNNYEAAETKQIIYIAKEYAAQLPQLLAALPDKNERIILIKNIELFDEATLAVLFEHPLVMYSGDLNTCTSKELLLQLKYGSKIFFSPLNNDFRLTLPPLERYHGYFLGRISQGTITLVQGESS